MKDDGVRMDGRVLSRGAVKLIWLANSMGREAFDRFMSSRGTDAGWLDGQWDRFRSDFASWYANVDDGLKEEFASMALAKYP